MLKQFGLGVKNTCFGGRKTLVQTLALPPPGCMTFDRSLNPSEFLYPTLILCTYKDEMRRCAYNIYRVPSTEHVLN